MTDGFEATSSDAWQIESAVWAEWHLLIERVGAEYVSLAALTGARPNRLRVADLSRPGRWRIVVAWRLNVPLGPEEPIVRDPGEPDEDFVFETSRKVLPVAVTADAAVLIRLTLDRSLGLMWWSEAVATDAIRSLAAPDGSPTADDEARVREAWGLSRPAGSG